MNPASPGPRIVIVNAVSSNGGDAAILQAEIRALRDALGAHVRIAVADDAPEVAGRLHPEIDFVPGLFTPRRPGRLTGWAKHRRSVRRRRASLAVRLLETAPVLAGRLIDARGRAQLDRLRKADAVIATGGTYLVEHYGVTGRLLEIRAAQALGRPTFLFTQSLGPFRRPRNRRLAAKVIGGAERVFVRDEASRSHLLEIGIAPERIDVHADFAFVLADADLPRRPADGPLRVAVSVREWTHFRSRSREEGLGAYRRAVADAVRRLRALGAEVEFVSTCQGVPEYWADDARFARRLVDELLPDLSGVRVDARFRRPRELLAHLTRFDLALATRMHFAVLALSAGVPVVPIAYEFKTTELFARLGMEALVEEIETIGARTLVPRVEAALARRAELRTRLAEAIPDLRRDAGAPARHVAAFLTGPTRRPAGPASTGA